MFDLAHPTGYDSVEKFESELSIARNILQPQSDTSMLPIGVGYLGWQLEKPDSPAVALLSSALKSRVQAIWLAFGDDLGQWVKFVRDRGDYKTLIFIQVSDVEEAKRAIYEWKADVIVAQGALSDFTWLSYSHESSISGIESGGHGNGAAPPLLSLISSVLSLSPIRHGPPILGAGGLAHGGHVAALLAMGASGGVLGTRFLLTPESLYSNAQKSALLAAKSSSSTIRTMAFDRARGTLGWPQGINGRALFNDTVRDDDNDVDIKIVQTKFLEAVKKEDSKRMLIWAGTGVSEMNEIKEARVFCISMAPELHRF